MDAFDLLRMIPDGAVDLVVTSPPYPGATMWDNDMQRNLETMNKLNLDALTECKRVVREGGVICWNLQDMPCVNHGIITTTTTILTTTLLEKL